MDSKSELSLEEVGIQKWAERLDHLKRALKMQSKADQWSSVEDLILAYGQAPSECAQFLWRVPQCFPLITKLLTRAHSPEPQQGNERAAFMVLKFLNTAFASDRNNIKRCLKAVDMPILLANLFRVFYDDELNTVEGMETLKPAMELSCKLIFQFLICSEDSTTQTLQYVIPKRTTSHSSRVSSRPSSKQGHRRGSAASCSGDHAVAQGQDGVLNLLPSMMSTEEELQSSGFGALCHAWNAVFKLRREQQHCELGCGSYDLLEVAISLSKLTAALLWNAGYARLREVDLQWSFGENLLAQMGEIILESVGAAIGWSTNPDSLTHGLCPGIVWLHSICPIVSLIVKGHQGNQHALAESTGVFGSDDHNAKGLYHVFDLIRLWSPTSSPSPPSTSSSSSSSSSQAPLAYAGIRHSLVADLQGICAALRYNNAAIQDAVDDLIGSFPSGARAGARRAMQLYDDFMDHSTAICNNSWDVKSTVGNVIALTTLLDSESCDARFLSVVAVVIPDFFRAFIGCLSNIDEDIMSVALGMLSRWIDTRPSMGVVQMFVECGGVWALAGGMGDCDMDITATALANVLALYQATAEQSKHGGRHSEFEVDHGDDLNVHTAWAAASYPLHPMDIALELRRSGMLGDLVQLVKDVVSADAPATLLAPTCAMINIACDAEFNSEGGRMQNLHILRKKKGMQALGSAWDVLLGGEGSIVDCVSLPLLCVSIANLLYHDKTSQATFAALGGFQHALDTLEALVARQRLQDEHGDRDMGLPALLSNVLSVLVNAVDSNAETQACLDASSTRDLLEAILQFQQDLESLSMCALLTSHVVWNHPGNQDLYATDTMLNCLLQLCDMYVPREEDGVQHAGEATTIRGSDESGEEGESSDDEDEYGPLEKLGEIVRSGGDASSLLAGGSQTMSQSPDFNAGLFAMLALVNISFQNTPVQAALGEKGGLEVVLKPLVSVLHYPYVFQKAAAFCVGNLVKHNKDNQLTLCELGGVKILTKFITDHEDDELTNIVFHTMVCLEQLGMEHLFLAIEEVATIMVDEGKDLDAGTLAEGLNALRVYLPVLNGLACVEDKNLEYVVADGKVAEMISLLNCCGDLMARLTAAPEGTSEDALVVEGVLSVVEYCTLLLANVAMELPKFTRQQLEVPVLGMVRAFDAVLMGAEGFYANGQALSVRYQVYEAVKRLVGHKDTQGPCLSFLLHSVFAQVLLVDCAALVAEEGRQLPRASCEDETAAASLLVFLVERCFDENDRLVVKCTPLGTFLSHSELLPVCRALTKDSPSQMVRDMAALSVTKLTKAHAAATITQEDENV